MDLFNVSSSFLLTDGQTGGLSPYSVKPPPDALPPAAATSAAAARGTAQKQNMMK